jgi:hypothetical protein
MIEYGMVLPYGLEDIEKLGIHFEGTSELQNGWLFIPVENITGEHVEKLYNAGIRNHEYRLGVTNK